MSTDTAQKQTLPEQVDIAIIGGGMVGASMAALLPQHFNILLIESFPLPSNKREVDIPAPIYQPSYDARSSALCHSTYQAFNDIGLWSMLAEHVQPIEQVHVSDKGNWGSTLLDQARQQSMPALGYVIENAWLGRCLLHFIQQKPNVRFASPAQVTQIQPVAGGVNLQIQQAGDKGSNNSHSVHAKLAVIADGAQSKICSSLGIHHQVNDYHHTAIVTNVSTSDSHQGIAYERFTDTGPLALLPLTSEKSGDHRSALIWTMATDDAEALLALSDDEFLQALQQRFGNRQGQFIKVGQRHSYPLKLSTAEEQVRQNIVVLGNAAHSLHPVAGQGFNLALRDVQVLCRHLSNSNAALGELSVLQAYADAQANDQLLTTLFSDVLPGLFAKKHPAIAAGRGLGLLGLELVPPLKSNFINFATGLRPL